MEHEGHGHRARWSETTTIEVDGEPVTIETTNVPPPGTPRRLYLFASPPSSDAEAAEITGHLAELRGLLEQASPTSD